MGLVSVNFQYVGYEKAETLRFYQRILRGFLRWHRTKAVWLKGSGRRKAHLIIDESLIKNALRMFLDGLRYGGHFQAQHEHLATVLWDARENDPETVGYLSYSGVQLGDSDEVFCPQDGYRKVTVDYCQGPSYEERCYSWAGYRCVYPRLTRTPKAMLPKDTNIEKKPRHDHL